MPRPKNQRNEFAELYVAGVFADRGWLVYFPREDKGFDFIVSRKVGDDVLMRPVQVTGKYPETSQPRPVYGFDRKFTLTHPQMVIAVPYFSSAVRLASPKCTAYLPWSELCAGRVGHSCNPATLEEGEPRPRPKYARFFDESGLQLVESAGWGTCGN